MNRRDAIIRLALLMGGAVVGPRLLEGAWDAGAPDAGGADPVDLALLDEIGETIIPATDIPGARAVHIGAFIAMMVRDCQGTEAQTAFAAGLKDLTARFQAKYGRSFVGAPATQRTEFLNLLNQEQTIQPRGKAANEPVHYFRLLKELTILGYFSSEIGSTQAVRYLEVPGSYDGNVLYHRGDRAWFV